MKIPPLCGRYLPLAASQPVDQPVAFGLVEGRKFGEVGSAGFAGQKGGNAGLEGGACGEHVVLVDLPNFSSQCFGGRHVTDFPAGAMQDFAKRSEHQRTLPQPRFMGDAEDLTSVMVHRSVHLVTHHQRIGALDQIRKSSQIFSAPR